VGGGDAAAAPEFAFHSRKLRDQIQGFAAQSSNSGRESAS
jgi:hypothetical protein